METIKIQEVLSLIRATGMTSAPFLLRYVKKQGRSRGKIQVIAKAVFGAPNRAPIMPSASDTESTEAESVRGKFKWKDHDMLPLTDLEDGNKFRTIPISHIIGYNQYQVIH